MSHDASPSLLVLVIDTDPILWHYRSLYLSDDRTILLQDFIKSLCIFCSAYSLVHRGNKLVILGNHRDLVHQIFPSSHDGRSDGDDFIPSLHTLSSTITENILSSSGYNEFDKTSYDFGNYENFPDTTSKSSLANVLSMTLCGKTLLLSWHASAHAFITLTAF